MNVAVIGIGGVGGYFGGKLTQLLSHDEKLKVYFIARNEHLREIQKNGLILETQEGTLHCTPTLAIDNPDELPVLDFVMVCVKGYDLQSVLSSIKSKITAKTIVLPLLNGVDIYDRIKAILPHATVLPSCVYVGTHIVRPGKVKQNGGVCTIHFGIDPKTNESTQKITMLFDRANIKYNLTEEPEKEIWSKFIFIAAFGLVTANYDKTLGQVLDNEDLKSKVLSIMNEILHLAKAKNVYLPESIVVESIEKGRKFSHDTKTSFQRDYEIQGKKDERDIFGGAILSLSKQYNVEVPTTKKIFESLNKKKIV